MEKWTVATSTLLNEYRSDWPGLAPVVRVEPERRIGGEPTVEGAYFITSLGRDRAGAGRLGDLIRGDWGIENRLHSVRDVTLGEGASRVRSGSSPQILAALRNAVVHLPEEVEAPSKAAATRRLAAHPDEAIRLILA